MYKGAGTETTTGGLMGPGLVWPVLLILLLVLTPFHGRCQDQAVAEPNQLPVPPTLVPDWVEVVQLANGHWPPHTGSDLPDQGCDSQVVVEAFALEGIRVEFQFLPWARGLLLSQSGVLDGAIEWADTPGHRASHFVSREPLSRQQWVFFHRRDRSFPWETLNDLGGAIIGLTIGYAYSDVFVDLQQRRPTQFTEAASDLLNLKKLLAGRIDLLPIERAVGAYLVRTGLTEQQQLEIVADPRPLADFFAYLLLSRAIAGNQERMTRFDRGLQRLKESGRYGEIVARCLAATPRSPHLSGASR